MSLFTLKERPISVRVRPGGVTRREQFAQGALIIGVSLLLGGYTLLFPRLPLTWAVLSLLVVMAPFVVLIVGDLRRLLLLIVMIDIPIQLDGHLFYRPALAAWGALAGFNYSLTTIALVGLYALWLVEWLVQPAWTPARARVRVAARPATPLRPLLLYVGCVALSLLVAVDRQLAAFELLLLLQLLLLTLYLVATVRTAGDLLFLVRLLLLGLLLQSLIMIGLRLLGHSLTFGPITARIDPDLRVGGTIGGPNTAAGYLTLVLPVAFALLWTPVDRATRTLAFVALGLGSVALSLTLSRGGAIGAVIALGLVLIFCWQRRRWSLPWLWVLALVGGLVLYMGASALLAARTGSAANGRWPLILLAFQIIRDYPLFGVGANNFAVVMPAYLTPDFSRAWLYIVHNKYLLVWAELGPVGFGAYLWFLLSTIGLGWRTWQRRTPTLAPLALGLTAGIIGHMAHMQVDLFNSRQLVQLLWLQAALITTLSTHVILQPTNPDQQKNFPYRDKTDGTT